jgi:hypothetical protein
MAQVSPSHRVSTCGSCQPECGLPYFCFVIGAHALRKELSVIYLHTRSCSNRAGLHPSLEDADVLPNQRLYEVRD